MIANTDNRGGRYRTTEEAVVKICMALDLGLEKSKEKSYLMFRMFRSAKVNGCTFKNVDAWLNSLPNRNPHGYKVFLWGGMNVELDIDDLLDEIEASVK